MNAQIIVPTFDDEIKAYSQSGYYKLSWKWDADLLNTSEQVFELQEASDEYFQQPVTLYKGPDLATFLSGMEDGHYYYRVRVSTSTGTSAWSAPVRMEVRHHSLSLALTLFSVGAIVFLLTVGIVIMGVQKSKATPV